MAALIRTSLATSHQRRLARCVGRGRVLMFLIGFAMRATETLCAIGRELLLPVRRQELLILFARFPEPGSTKTRLIPALGAVGAAKLQHEMTLHALAAADELRRFRPNVKIETRFAGGTRGDMRRLYGQRLFAPQGNGDLGQKLARAAREGFGRGAGAIVMIGTDCPQLSASLLGDAFERLRMHDVVLGPAEDGGYYLIGLRDLHSELFEGIDWGTAAVLRQTLDAVQELGLTLTMLPILPDVDRPEDLPVWYRARERTLVR